VSTDIEISCHHSNRYGGELENSVFYDIYQSDMTAARRHGSPDCIWQYRTILSR
jgi:hypothetical protein